VCLDDFATTVGIVSFFALLEFGALLGVAGIFIVMNRIRNQECERIFLRFATLEPAENLMDPEDC
jgi:hypothetical protein